MIGLTLALIVAAFALSCPLTAWLIRLGHRWRAYDTPPVPGQVKLEQRAVPNLGGLAIVWSIALPTVAGLAWVHADAWLPAPVAREAHALLPAAVLDHLPGIRAQTPLALLLLAALGVLHLLGLVDDRRPVHPGLKAMIMAIPAAAVPLVSDTRLLTVLDHWAGGPWLSLIITFLWLFAITNALNFMDNVDGLAGGVSVVAGGCFLAATLVSPQPQWFVAAMLALMVGASLGFLVFNAPRPGGAAIYMGDAGSLVLGFLLGFLTVRTTYYHGGPSPAGGWHAVFMPLAVLAVPLYDLVSVTTIRLVQRRSPFVGDTQHLSHRLTALGLSRPAAVGVILGLTAVTGISGIVLASLRPWQAVLVGLQVVLLLAVVALFEYSRAVASRNRHTQA